MPNRSVNKSIRNTCIFAGPSLAGHTAPPQIETFPPATRGALTAALASGYTRIGFVDGAIEESERVPLRELREALATPGVTVLGGASMGAIRAVQLASDGMRGHGRVFRLFRRGSLTDRDEVYVLHAPGTLHYRCLTIPLVNIRYTFRALRLADRLSRGEEHARPSKHSAIPSIGGPYYLDDQPRICVPTFASGVMGWILLLSRHGRYVMV